MLDKLQLYKQLYKLYNILGPWGSSTNSISATYDYSHVTTIHSTFQTYDITQTYDISLRYYLVVVRGLKRNRSQ